MKELDIIRWLRERTGPATHVLAGIGDDAAVLDSSRDDRTVVTTDLILEGTHFAADAAPADAQAPADAAAPPATPTVAPVAAPAMPAGSQSPASPPY